MAERFDWEQARMAKGLGNAMHEYLANNVPEADRVKIALSVAMTYAWLERWRLSEVLRLARSVYRLCGSMFIRRDDGSIERGAIEAHGK